MGITRPVPQDRPRAHRCTRGGERTGGAGLRRARGGRGQGRRRAGRHRPPRRRSVLAALLVDVNRVVPVDELVDRVWASTRRRARHSLYSHLSGLRRVVAPVGASLTRQAGGYVLTVDPASVDLHLFRELCARSREGDRPLAAADRALALWRGRAFEGADTPWFAEVARRLEQERLAAELHRNDLLLR
ncbi:winged helix-turn-helix domain-containing protein, partial [Saccharothrix sp. MB29]|nr:winged helix-turn-helix domain-containing protein [Saccharothrix sp. MB29]